MSPDVAGIVLAAGTGSRMGCTKQLLPWEGTTLLGRVLDHARAADLDHRILVLGHDADRIQNQVDTSGFQIVINADHSQGQSTSLKAGLDVVSTSSQAALFILGDQPLITPDILNFLIQNWKQNTPLIQIPRYRGATGNPVMVRHDLFLRLTTLSGDTGARVLFQAYPSRIHFLDCPHSAVIQDVDTPLQYAALKGLTPLPLPTSDLKSIS